MITNPNTARARVHYLYEEGFVDAYQITQNALGQTLIMIYVDDDDGGEWSVFFDETDVDYEALI